MGEIMKNENKVDVEPHTTVIGNLVILDKFRLKEKVCGIKKVLEGCLLKINILSINLKIGWKGGGRNESINNQ